jgi:hypothetical protein
MISPTPGTAPVSAAGGMPQLSRDQVDDLLRSMLALAADSHANTLSEALPRLSKLNAPAQPELQAVLPVIQRFVAGQDAEFLAFFGRRLRERQEEILARVMPGRAQTQRRSLELDASALELVSESDDHGSTLVARGVRRLAGGAELPLREVESIFCALTGRDHLVPTDSPLGVEPVAWALLQAAQDGCLASDAQPLFLELLCNELRSGMEPVFNGLLEAFRGRGVDPRAMRRAHSLARRGGPSAAAGASPSAAPALELTPLDGEAAGEAGGAAAGAGAAAGPAGAGGAAGAAAGGGGPQPDVGTVLSALLARMQGGGGGLPVPVLDTPPGPVPDELLRSLRELQHLGSSGVAGAAVGGAPAGTINAWREHLISKSDRTVDKLTIEVTGMMFDHILRDAQVPDEIKAVLSRLQFPILKAALLDAAFFASSSHPARRLIDRVANASIGWEPYGDENARFKAEVERVVSEVTNRFEGDVGVFERALNEFEAFLGDIGPRDSDPIAKAKRALEEAEKREVLVINTTIQVRRVLDKVQIDAWLRDFLVGPWVQVLAQASLRDDQTKGFSKSFRELMHELVWSVQPKATAEERKRLLTLIPHLTRTLRDGLALIRLPQRDQDDFFQALMRAHAVAVKPTDQATYIRSSLQSSEIRAKVEGLQLTASFPLTAVPGGVKIGAGAMLQAAAEHQVEIAVPTALTDVGTLNRDEELRLDQDLAGWSRGSWFEIWNGKEFVRARLRWISPLRTMFMFSAGNDKRAQVMSPDLIRSYLRRNLIRPLERGAPLTERVASAVVAEFKSSPERTSQLTTRLTQT